MAGWRIVSGDTFANIYKNSGVWTYGETLCGLTPEDCDPYTTYDVKAELEDGDGIKFPHFCSDEPTYVDTYCGKVAQLRENISCNEEMLVMWFEGGDNFGYSDILSSNDGIFDIKNVDECEHLVYSPSGTSMIREGGGQLFESSGYTESGYPAIDSNPYDATFTRKYTNGQYVVGHKIKYHTVRDDIPSSTLVDCQNLVELYFPHLYDEAEGARFTGKNILRIEAEAFYNCPRLTAITFSAVEEIGENAFYNCQSLKNIDWGHFACDSGQTGTTSYPNSKPTRVIRSIEGSAFYNCNSLEILDLSGLPITYIGENAFENCYQLKKLTLPLTTGYDRIQSNTFYNSTSLSSVTIPSNVTTIGNAAFAVDGLFHTKTVLAEELKIPNTVEYIGSAAFDGYNMSALTITTNSNYNIINVNTFANNPNLTSVTIPSNITEIGESAFESCIGLSSVTINGTSLKKIKEGAFQDCKSLTAITIPSSVNSGSGLVGDSAFFGCDALDKVRFMSSTPPEIGDELPVFPDTIRRIQVPSASAVTAYKTKWGSILSQDMLDKISNSN